MLARRAWISRLEAACSLGRFLLSQRGRRAGGASDKRLSRGSAAIPRLAGCGVAMPGTT